MKRIKQGGILVLLALCAVGCCTQRLREYSHLTTQDMFIPHLLFQETNGTRLAFEGKLYKNVPQGTAYAGEGKWRSLVMPDTGRWRLPVGGREEQWLHDCYDTLCKLAQDSKLQDSMPSEYQKVTEFHDTNWSLPMPHSQRQPRRGAMAWAPLTVIADVILSPFQLMGFAMLAFGHHC
jgi:hypothetical protein